MTVHPVNALIAVLDLAALAVAAVASVTAVRIALYWQPAATDRRQIRLEAAADIAGLHSRLAIVTFAAGTILLIAAVAYFLPPVIPGAMCGTGVMQAMGPGGSQMLLLRASALVLMAAWWVLERLDAGNPLTPLAPVTARLWLVLFPVMAVAVLSTFQALAALNPHQPVSCCAVVYDAAVNGLTASTGGTAPGAVAVWGVGGVMLAAACLMGMRSSTSRGGPVAVLISGGGLAWTALSAVVLIRTFSAYIYEVLFHPCPWCLFLPEHGAVGIVLYAALAVVALESVATGVCAAVLYRAPSLAEAAVNRIRRGAIRILFASVAFTAMAAVPALLWRLRYGVWMHG